MRDDSVEAFYDGFAEDYHLAYADDWDAAVDRQASVLDRLIRAGVPDAHDVLDCACGIGTQAIGLALLGYAVDGSDISPGALTRARGEAERLGATVQFALADMRALDVAPGSYDAVIACDNALPHLLTEEDVVQALRSMAATLRPEGLVILTVRDFDEALVTRPPVAAPISLPGPPRRVLVRLHDWDADAPLYTVRYLVLTEEGGRWQVVEHATRYRAITRDELSAAATAAGLRDVRWHDDEDTVLYGQQTISARR